MTPKPLREQIADVLKAHEGDDLDTKAQAVTTLILDLFAPPF